MDDDLREAIDRLLRRPVAFFPIFAEVGGSVTAGVMLSQLWYWSDGRGWDAEGWIKKTSQEWAVETSLTESEVEGARKKLLAADLIYYKRAGTPAKPYYLLNKEAVLSAVSAVKKHNKIDSLPNLGKQDSRKMANKFRGKRKTSSEENAKHNTESTPETTSESTPYTTTEEVVGGGIEIKSKTKWKLGEVVADLDLFVSAAVLQTKVEIKNPSAYKSAIRKRIESNGPSAEDWDLVLAFLKFQQNARTVSALSKIDAVENEKLISHSEKGRHYFESLDQSDKKIEILKFSQDIQTKNPRVHQAFVKNGLKSGIVQSALFAWLAEKLP